MKFLTCVVPEKFKGLRRSPDHQIRNHQIAIREPKYAPKQCCKKKNGVPFEISVISEISGKSF
jgi:hypothetical protein